MTNEKRAHIRTLAKRVIAVGATEKQAHTRQLIVKSLTKESSSLMAELYKRLGRRGIKPLAARVGFGAATGAAGGALAGGAAGAVSPEGTATSGAGKGALTGAALGGLAGLLSGRTPHRRAALTYDALNKGNTKRMATIAARAARAPKTVRGVGGTATQLGVVPVAGIVGYEGRKD